MVERVMQDFTQKDLNCAESTLEGANVAFDLGLSDDDIKLIGGFGGGLGCGKLCGALAASIAAIGKVMITDRAHITPGLKEACAGFTKLFEEEFGGTECADLRARLVPPGQRCNMIMERNAQILEKYLKELKGE